MGTETGADMGAGADCYLVVLLALGAMMTDKVVVFEVGVLVSAGLECELFLRRYRLRLFFCNDCWSFSTFVSISMQTEISVTVSAFLGTSTMFCCGSTIVLLWSPSRGRNQSMTTTIMYTVAHANVIVAYPNINCNIGAECW
jgi:hypothetical protein